MRIAMTSVYVTNPVSAYFFYTEVLGFVQKLFVPEAMLAVVVSKHDVNGAAILLEPNLNPIARSYQDGLRAAGLPMITFGVDDIEAEVARLKSQEVEFKKEPTITKTGIEAIFDDQHGNFIQIFQLRK